MDAVTRLAAGKPNYTVKASELVIAGPGVQARLFTLAPKQGIPWHYHSEITDHYFVLRGKLTIQTQNPDRESTIETGNCHLLAPGIAHLVENRDLADCQFLLLQGVGKYDWIKFEG